MAKESVDPRLAHLIGDPRRGRLQQADQLSEAQVAEQAEQQRKAKEYSEGSLKKFAFKPWNCLCVYVPLSQQIFFSYDSRDPEAIEGFLCPGPSNMGLHFPRAFQEMKRDQIAPDHIEFFEHDGKKILIHTMLDIIGTGVIWQIVKKPEWWPKLTAVSEGVKGGAEKAG